MSNERWREGDRNKEGWERFEEFDKRGGEGGGLGEFLENLVNGEGGV